MDKNTIAVVMTGLGVVVSIWFLTNQAHDGIREQIDSVEAEIAKVSFDMRENQESITEDLTRLDDRLRAVETGFSPIPSDVDDIKDDVQRISRILDEQFPNSQMK